jgi:digalactosyldiacylglycerol synthase
MLEGHVAAVVCPRTKTRGPCSENNDASESRVPTREAEDTIAAYYWLQNTIRLKSPEIARMARAITPSRRWWRLPMKSSLVLLVLVSMDGWTRSTGNANNNNNNNKGRFWGSLFRRNATMSGDERDTGLARQNPLESLFPSNRTKPKRSATRNPLRAMFARLKRRRSRKGKDDAEAGLASPTVSPYSEDDFYDYEDSDSFSDEDYEEEDEEEDWSPSMEEMARKQIQSLKLQRQKFFDHIALISSSFLKRETLASVTSTEDNVTLDDHVTPQTDLSLPGRHFHIVTTAALPWMTGTAVNPLLRAAYLHRRTQSINSGFLTEQVNVEIILGETEEPVNYTTASHRVISLDQQQHTNSSTTCKQQQQQQQQWVTLVIPWLELEEDQRELYGQVFASPQAQEDYIRAWLADDAGMPDVASPDTGLKLLFYPARYHSGLRSIFAMGDICALIPSETSDVCVLEEPEHISWYRAPGDGWTQKFNYVVGIVHTNYKEYASAHYSGLWTAPAIALISSAMVRAYCHQVIKLSDVLQTFAPEKEATSNVHGVRSAFLEIGLAASNNKMEDESSSDPTTTTNTTTSAYFIGKLLWAKGLDLLLEMQDYYKQVTGQYFPIDIYGSGPEQKAIKRAYLGRNHRVHHHTNTTGTSSNATHRHHHHRHRSRRLQKQGTLVNYLNTTKIFTSKAAFGEHLNKIKESLRNEDPWRNLKESFESAKGSIPELPATFHEWRRQPIPATFPGRVDHASLGQHADQYKIFVNPSISEVLCTTTAEALAMGKFAIIPVHPSNAFFLKFPNCLAYRNKFEFAANLQWALTHEPEPLTPELAHHFTWEAATDRFVQASAVTWKEAREREKLGLGKRDERIAWFLNELGKGPKGDIIRMMLGGGPVSAQVKYVQSKLKLMDDDEDEEAVQGDGLPDDPGDDEDEGLTNKFHQSSIVQALRATVANGLPSTIVGSRES